MLHPPRRYPRRPVTTVLVVAGASVLALAGCTKSGSDDAAAGDSPVAATSKAAPSTPSVPEAQVTVSPAGDADEIAPDTPITVKAEGGMLGDVVVTAPDGTQVPGTLAKDALSWTSAGTLAYGTTYTVTSTASNRVGTATTSTSTFSTVKPGTFTLPYINTASGYSIQDGNTYGVGQALQIHWDEPIGDRAAAQKAVSVTLDPPQPAAFSWVDDQNMMWRTKDYLQPGTKVTVAANVFGLKLGDDLWGQENRSTSFVVGDSHVSVVDDSTHMVTVYENGTAIRTMPTSLGQGGTFTASNGQTISLWTNSGPHIVIEKAQTVRMTSSSYGLPKTDPLGYDTVVNWGVKISEDGEYAHAAPWNNNLGVSDESHGCLNLSTADAQWFYDYSLPGDIVDVKGTPQNLAEWNSGAWTVPWDQWVARSALPVA